MKVDEHREKPTAADAASPSGGVALDMQSHRPQIWPVVSYALRLRLVFSMLTAFAAVYGVSEANAQRADVCIANAQLDTAQSPTGPLHLAAPEMTDAVSGEDTPDDEELADLAKSLLGRAPALVQCALASIQLEPSHAPSTQLDRPPRA